MMGETARREHMPYVGGFTVHGVTGITMQRENVLEAGWGVRYDIIKLNLYSNGGVRLEVTVFCANNTDVKVETLPDETREDI